MKLSWKSQHHQKHNKLYYVMKGKWSKRDRVMGQKEREREKKIKVVREEDMKEERKR